MAERAKLLSPGFVMINLLFGLVTSIAALFFLFSGYLRYLGIDPAMVGFILSADGLAALILQPFITPLIHGNNVRRWLISGAILFSCSLLMLGNVTSLPLLIMARLLQGAGFITVLSSLTTILIPFIPEGMSGRAFGYVSLVRLVPYAVIPLLADVFAFTPSSFSILLMVSGMAALIPILMLFLPGKQPDEAPGVSQKASLLPSLGSRHVLFVLSSALLFFCGYAAIFFYLKEYGTAAGIPRAGFFFTIATLVMIGIRLFGSAMFDRLNKPWTCATALLVLAACYGVMTFNNSATLFFSVAFISGLGWGIAMPLQAAVMFDISSPTARAMNQNLLLVMMQGGFFLGPFLGGNLIARYGYSALFIFLAVFTLAAAILMTGTRKPG
jgi:predicted MFS family arabinose efflux permease